MKAFRSKIYACLWTTGKVSESMKAIDDLFKETTIPFPIASSILEQEIRDRRTGYPLWALEYDLWCSYVRHADKSVDDRLYALGNVGKAHNKAVHPEQLVAMLGRFIEGVLADRN